MRICLLIGSLSIFLLQPLYGQNHEHSDAEENLDVLHYEFTILIPDSGRSIKGAARLVVRRTRDARLARIDLVGLSVDSVEVNGAKTRYQRDQGSLIVSLPPQSANSCDTLSLQVAYGGEVRDGLIIRHDHKGRWSAFGDNWPERARYWLPCIDRPDDKATVEWKVLAPSEMEVVANGAFIERIPMRDGSGILHALTVWKESQPISTYLMVIAVAPLVKFDLSSSQAGIGGNETAVQQSVYARPELLNLLPGPFKFANDIVKYYSSIVGPFPYEKLAHVQSSTRYGGMENASAIFYADEGFASRTMAPEIIAHETAHQWFGDAVTEKQWAHLWLSEGFATYFEELWTRHQFGDSAFQAEMERTRHEIMQSQVVAQRPVIDTLQNDLMNLLDVNSYQKGAWVLHMLHSMLGDSIFFGALRSYYDHYRNSTALTDDLEREFETRSNQNLRWFFDEWLRRPGYINIATHWSYDEKAKRVELLVHQDGPFPPYRFQLIVQSTSYGGKRSRETLMVRATAMNVFTLQRSFEKQPMEIRIDPDVELLAKIVVH
jgi:aminopeptidase N